jgi:hypothetical protein
MTTSIAPERTARKAAPSSRFGDLGWLDAQHPIFKANEAAWKRDERRFYGGDGVLTELRRWDGESNRSFDERKNEAVYVNFARAHVNAVTGELSRHRPMPDGGLSFGGMGPIRTRDRIDRPSLAELAYYNIDGVGQDGSEFPAWMDDVDVLAQVTGHRWLMIEHPATDGAVSLEAAIAGQRPFAVHRSPLSVPNWFIARGQLQFAVARVPVDDPKVENGAFVHPGDRLGFYLLVRRGFDRLGQVFARGGWWLFDNDKKLLRDGTWDRTNGDIPMWPHYGEKSDGSAERPAMSRANTTELGQIGIGLMNVTSARDGDFWDGCKPLTMLLGADPPVMEAVVGQLEKQGIYIGVPHAASADGQLKPITVYDGSASVVPAEVAKMIVEAKFAEAREQSFQQITSTPDSSGRSKEMGHAENKAPLLTRRARYRQQSENTLIHFLELRSGIAKPSGSSVWPTEFDLAPLVETIKDSMDMLRRSRLRSKTAEVALTLNALEESGAVDEADLKKIETELGASFDAGEAQAEAMRTALGAGGAPPIPGS